MGRNGTWPPSATTARAGRQRILHDQPGAEPGYPPDEGGRDQAIKTVATSASAASEHAVGAPALAGASHDLKTSPPAAPRSPGS